jgi:superoxide dismutase
MKMVVDTNCTPILCLNVWEHCYWEEHEGEADGSYIEAFWLTLDWNKISENFEKFNLAGNVAPIA